MDKISKHFHLTLHFTVTGDESEIPTTGVNFQKHPNCTRSGSDTFWREHDERMRRLYKAVVNDKQALYALFASRISAWLETETYQFWDTILFDEGMLDEHNNEVRLEDMLQPALAALSKEDREILLRHAEEQVLYENVEEFLDCFSANLTGVDFTEVEMRGEQ